MSYSFDEVIDRRGTNSIKWEYNKEIFGSDDVLPLWVADMDFACPPAVSEAIAARAKHPIYGYPGKPKAMHRAVTGWLDRRFGVKVRPQLVSTVPGVVTGIHLAIDAFTKPGDHIIVQPPVYPPFFSAVKNRGRHVVENPLKEQDGRYEMDFEDLMNKIDARTRMIILCSPHNPVGRVWTAEELHKLAAICIKHDIFVVSDEIHSDLVYEKGAHTPFYSLSEEAAAQSLTFISPSKTFNLAGLFSSIAIAGDERIHREFTNAAAKSGFFHINLFGIEAMTAAYREGEAWLEALLKYLDKNAEFVHSFLQDRVPGVKMEKPEGTYLGWMDFRQFGMSDPDLKKWLVEKAKVGLNAGDPFGKAGKGFQRINFACPRSILEDAMERIEKARNGV
ncbi:MAG TPA: PatB family C-S lyase [Bacillales bacterium]|nr:PatB family C-S lyase [Bacillales bacterium]